MAARSGWRAALSGRRAIAAGAGAAAADRVGGALRAAVEHGGGSRAGERSELGRTGAGPAGEHGTVIARPEAWGDVILARKETPTSYHLSVVIDDALQGVTEIIRGQDLFWSTSVHRLLQGLLGITPPAYRHHRLIRDLVGQKLSKSTKASALRKLRAGGATPADIRRLVGLP